VLKFKRKFRRQRVKKTFHSYNPTTNHHTGWAIPARNLLKPGLLFIILPWCDVFRSYQAREPLSWGNKMSCLRAHTYKTDVRLAPRIALRGRGWNKSQPDLRHYHSIFLNRLRSTTKNSRQRIQYTYRHLNPRRSKDTKQQAAALPTVLSVQCRRYSITPVMTHSPPAFNYPIYILSYTERFYLWRHTWQKNWVNCAVLKDNSAGIRTVLSSRLSHTELNSSLRESHTFPQFTFRYHDGIISRPSAFNIRF
jgi:hypothetical protein